ncbi:MAG: hypothetical protein PHH77_02545 [Victivallaceae bacterium]|nr:hypothetical protein [Victivallaceae bacterium]
MSKKNKKLLPKIGVAALSSPLEIGAGRAPGVAAEFTDKLAAAGCTVINLGALQNIRDSRRAGMKLYDERAAALLAVPVSWYEDYLIIDLLEEWPGPLLLWPLPGLETGALCGAQQNMSFLKRLHHPAEYVFGEPNNRQCLEQAMKFFRAAALAKIMRRAKIGLAGHRVNGMTHTSPNEFMLKRDLGVRVIPLDLPEILAGAESQSEPTAAEKWHELCSAAGSCNVSEPEGIYSVKMYFALKKAVEEKELDALAVGCYPQLMGKVCLAASLLADDGVPLACEGDVNGAAAMLMLNRLSGEAVHNCDWLEPIGRDTVLFTHCGSGSFSLAQKREDINLASVRLMGQGVCAQFPSKPGPVTLLNLTPGENGYLSAVLEGKAVETEMLFPGNPLKVRFKTPLSEINDWIFSNGLGHHWMAAYGNYFPEIKYWSQISGKNLNRKNILALN